MIYDHKKLALLLVGMTAEAVEEKTGVKISSQTLGNWCQGETKPKADVLGKIGKAFNKEAGYFYTNE